MNAQAPFREGSDELEELRQLQLAQRDEYRSAIQELRAELLQACQDIEALKCGKTLTVSGKVMELPGVSPALPSVVAATELTGSDVPQQADSLVSIGGSSPTAPKSCVLEDMGVAWYEFSQSMWDAALLCFFDEVNFWDKTILLFGLFMNHILQGLLLAVVWLDMLDNPFPMEKTMEMLEWRVSVGHSHSNFDEISGETKLMKLCSQQLWGFEQEEYSEMHAYLYKPIPGYYLSMLALLLWILTTIVEFRSAWEQATALATLPRAKPGKDCIVDTGDGHKICAIRPWARVTAITIITLPRLVVVSLIAFVGCKYLAQTVSLADIVLNAVALAFVLDVDELLFYVICTQKIRKTLTNLRPLPCSFTDTRIRGSIQISDLCRMTLAVATMMVAYQMFLIPFHASVEGAANALCGGLHDFTFRGGTVDSPTVWLHNSSDHEASCQSDNMKKYVNTFYNNYTAGGTDSMMGQNDVVDYMMTRKQVLEREMELRHTCMEVVLKYAFSKGCGPGMILSPPNPDIDLDDPEARWCMHVPEKLFHGLHPFGIQPGVGKDPPRCRQFQPQIGKDTCNEPAQGDGDACLWSWFSNRCESAPPGDFNRWACTNKAFPTRDEVSLACTSWGLFERTSPFYNCRALSMCTGNVLSCVTMRGNLYLDHMGTIADGTSANATNTSSMPPRVLIRSLKQALANASGLSEDLIAVTLAVPEPLVGNWPGGPTAAQRPPDISRESVTYTFQRCPITFVPEVFFSGDHRDKILAALLSAFESLNVDGSPVTQVSFGNTQFLRS